MRIGCRCSLSFPKSNFGDDMGIHTHFIYYLLFMFKVKLGTDTVSTVETRYQAVKLVWQTSRELVDELGDFESEDEKDSMVANQASHFTIVAL